MTRPVHFARLLIAGAIALAGLATPTPAPAATAPTVISQLPCGPDAFSSSHNDPCTVTTSQLDASTVQVRIDQPVVDRSSYDYSTVTFQPGDQVVVAAGGCVQTAGSGSTWKRYADPGGSDSDHLYYGTVTIPSVMLGSTPLDGQRVRDVIGRPVYVPAATHLILGYVDDDYTGHDGNGYWGHDDGNDNQCAANNDGGSAYVILTITHGRQAPTPTQVVNSQPCGPDAFSSSQGHNPCTITTSQLDASTIQARIDQPVVDRSSYEYSTVTFQPGDQVVVAAGGCVQTAGSGSTWKRYVSPGGSDSDHLYYGTVTIPSALLGSNPLEGQRVREVVGRPVYVPAATDLILGYVDGDYTGNGGNGYWGHDDGNDNQCATNNDGGSAYVILTITHGIVGPFPPTPAAPFDLVPNGWDDNGLFLNPHWGWQVPGNPLQAYNRDCVSAPCITQTTSYDAPSSLPSYKTWMPHVCSDDLAYAKRGHRDWFDATYTGTIQWKDHDGGLLGDDDYNMLLETPTVDKTPFRAAVTQNNPSNVLIEYDSDETIDHFDSIPWWNDFHHQGVDNFLRPQAAGSFVNGHQAVVIGLVGMDEMHGPHTEVHPVHVLAIRKDLVPDPNDDVWEIFARNWGNEGECSSNDHFLNRTTIHLRLPRPGNVGNQAVADLGAGTVFRAFKPVGAPTLYSGAQPGQDPVMTFELPAGSEHGFVVGELHLHWSGSSSAPAAQPGVVQQASLAAPTDDSQEPLDAIADKLTPEQLAAGAAAFAQLAPPSPVETVPLQVTRTNVAPVPPASVPTVSEGPALQMLQREESRTRALCVAVAGQVPDHPDWCPSFDFPPVTTSSSPGGQAGKDGWLVTPVTLTLTARAANASGIDYTEYSFDNAQWTRYSTPFNVPDGVTTVFYRSKDKAGHLEETRQQHFKVDALAPRTMVTIGSSPQLGGTQQQVFVTSATSIALTTADATSGVDSLSYRVFPRGSTPPAYTVVSGSTASLTLQGVDGPYELDTFGTDKAGNTESTQVQVLYLDNTPPTITGAATSSPNAQGWYNAPATVHFTCGDALSGVASCSPDATLSTEGATQSLSGTATDRAGNTATVTVGGINIDRTPPVLTVPDDIMVDATSPAGAVVTYAATATDTLSGASAVSCSPASGGTFVIGTTTVTCNVSDAAGNVTTKSFPVKVKSAAEQLTDLIGLVQSFNLKQGIATSLDSKLAAAQAAQGAAGAGDRATACNQLGAFSSEVQAQSGKVLTADQTAQLLGAATRIRAVLACG